MSYSVKYDNNAQKFLEKLEKKNHQDAVMIYNYIGNNLEGCNNPRTIGKALEGEKQGLWRYRVGDYRLIAVIQDDIVTISIIKIGNRKNVYK